MFCFCLLVVYNVIHVFNLLYFISFFFYQLNQFSMKACIVTSLLKCLYKAQLMTFFNIYFQCSR